MAQKLVVDDAIAKSFLDLDCKTIISSKDDAQKLLDLGIAESQKPATPNKPEQTSNKKQNSPAQPKNNGKKTQPESPIPKQDTPKQKPKSSNGSAKRKRKKQRQKQESAASVQKTPTPQQNKPVDKVATNKKNKKEKKNITSKEKKTKKTLKINLSFLKLIPAFLGKLLELLGNRIALGIGMILFVIFAILSIL